MMTLESEGGPVLGVWLRDGDGRCFFPRRQINAHGDIATPLLATGWVGAESFVHWRDYTGALDPVHGSYCLSPALPSRAVSRRVGPPALFGRFRIRSIHRRRCPSISHGQGP